MIEFMIVIIALLFNSITQGVEQEPPRVLPMIVIPSELSVECAEAVLTAEVPETPDKPRRFEYASEEAYKVGMAKFANGGASKVTLSDGTECTL